MCLLTPTSHALHHPAARALQNTGTTPTISRHGLLTTVAFKLGPDTPAMFALEGGSVAHLGGQLVAAAFLFERHRDASQS